MKNFNLENLEILSPAGNPECFFANINNGADAVYLGLSSFNARMKAENFTKDNIREYIKFAHKFGVKVYITVNTLLEDDDFDKFLEMIKVLTEAKADAFIVQDLGVAHLLKTAFDGIILHASTQMGIHNLIGAKIAETMGFSRIVLSREATLEDIKDIKQHTNLEIEYFVQGALCVAFSGNCYLSSLEKNASGNEGKCLQLCRLPYENNLDNKSAYYLSTRDLSLLENLEKLIDAGVTSFKIEGRMRHAGYTATATKIYKTALELLNQNALSKTFLADSEIELKTTYSRGDYNKNAYLEKLKTEPVIFSDYQNHIGIKIGTVEKVEPFKNNLFKATLKLTKEISSGDGLKIINPKLKLQVASLGVGNLEKIANDKFIIYTKTHFSAGLDVRLTQSSKNEEKILKNIKKIPLKIKIKAFSNSPLELVATAKINNSKTYSASFKTDFILEKATKVPLEVSDFVAQFEKLADSCVYLDSLELESDGIFLPKSKLNEIRRNIILLIENTIINENEKTLNVTFNEANFNKLKAQKIISNPTNLVIFRTLAELKNLNQNIKSDTIYVFEPDNYNPTEIKNATNILKDNFALSVPTILDFEDRLYFENILNSLPNKVTLYIKNIGAIYYQNLGHKIIVSPLLNIKNNYALKCLNSQNISIIASSIEADNSFVSKYNLISFKNGSFPLMTFAHCPYKAVTKTTCDSCKYNGKLEYKNQNLGNYKIRRTKLKHCQFELMKLLNRPAEKFFIENFKY